MTLEILLEALEAYVARSADDENTEEGLHIGAEASFLAEKQQSGFNEGPEDSNGDKEKPEEEDAALEMD